MVSSYQSVSTNLFGWPLITICAQFLPIYSFLVVRCPGNICSIVQLGLETRFVATYEIQKLAKKQAFSIQRSRNFDCVFFAVSNNFNKTTFLRCPGNILSIVWLGLQIRFLATSWVQKLMQKLVQKQDFLIQRPNSYHHFCLVWGLKRCYIFINLYIIV